MNLDELTAINRATQEYMAARRAGTPSAGAKPRGYYGYVDIDIYDCPSFVMFTNNDAPAVDTIVSRGTYEPTSINLWCAVARHATGILDVGAHVGIYSLCAAKLRPDIAVHAVEPNPYAFARLRMHKHVNELSNLVEHPVALGRQNGFVKFVWTVKPGGNIASGACISRHEGPGWENIVVPIVAPESRGIPTALGPNPLIKIDVEGSERFVFEGLAPVLEGATPDIVLETFMPEVCARFTPYFEKLGYFFYQIREKERLVEQKKELLPVTDGSDDYNQLMTRRSPAELGQLLPPNIKVVV